MMFLFILVAVWVISVGAWWFLSRSLRTADVGKIRSRLVDPGGKKKEKKTNKSIALIYADEAAAGHVIVGLLQRLELRDRLHRLVEQAGLRWKVARLMHGCLGMFLGGYAAGWLLFPPQHRTFAFVPALIAGASPLLYVLRKRGERLHKFEEQFPESLEFVARSMRAGHAFSVSLEMLHREFQEPLAGEFRRTFEEHNLGMPLEMALEKLATRVPSLDVHFFVSAVMLQKRTGGNLAEILDKLAYLMRERFKLRGRIKAISAHGRMTGTALTLIPVGVALLMFWANPDYVRFFFNDELGNYMMGGAVLLQLIGYAVIQKIVNIEV
ncbi:MAG: type II secretion system F family protein [Acidobacteria bacterium]|nr:type II secretion system F family protein [Acidobacteriota bacterium]